MKIKRPIDLFTGAIFETLSCGKLKVLDYKSARNVDVEFVDTGFKTSAQAGDIRRGSVKDYLKPMLFGVGFFGSGNYKARVGGILTVRYNTWADMIQRCYDSSYHDKKPTYSDCTVCDEWHNYQNFAAWFDENHVDGYQLDKDIKIDGNKHYSPETCMFVTGLDNAIKAFAKNYKFVDPLGVLVEIYNLSDFCRGKDLISSGLCNVHNGKWVSYKGWTKA